MLVKRSEIVVSRSAMVPAIIAAPLPGGCATHQITGHSEIRVAGVAAGRRSNYRASATAAASRGAHVRYPGERVLQTWGGENLARIVPVEPAIWPKVQFAKLKALSVAGPQSDFASQYPSFLSTTLSSASPFRNRSNWAMNSSMDCSSQSGVLSAQCGESKTLSSL
jgi:hypothetical protein